MIVPPILLPPSTGIEAFHLSPQDVVGRSKKWASLACGWHAVVDGANAVRLSLAMSCIRNRDSGMPALRGSQV